MKKLVGLLACVFMALPCITANSAPLPPKDALNEYFAISFLISPGSEKYATIAANYSEDGLTWKMPTMVPLKGKPSNAVRGVDITNHNYGALQGFAHDFNSLQLDRLFGKKLPSGLKIDPPMPPFPVAKTGPPATVILPDGEQILVCNTDGKISVFKGKMDSSAGFKKMTWNCESNVMGRPDVAFMRGMLLFAWRVPSKGIMTALYKRDPLGKLKLIKCENPFYTGPVGIYSEPVLASSDEVFYMGLVVKKQGEPAPQFKIFRGPLGTNWKEHATLGKASLSKIKLGLAAKLAGELFAAMAGETKSGVKVNAWLYHQDPKQGWKWTDLVDAPWGKVAPALKEFGLDRGGVRR